MKLPKRKPRPGDCWGDIDFYQGAYYIVLLERVQKLHTVVWRYLAVKEDGAIREHYKAIGDDWYKDTKYFLVSDS